VVEHKVHSSGQIPVTADRVWSVVRDFCGTWHPAVTTLTAESDDAGGLIRAFTVKGEQTIYRERLTWFSDSEQSMYYTHIGGISGVESYNARLSVSADNDTQCTFTMSARLAAPEPRATEIAKGTKSIFDDAIATVASLATSTDTKSLVSSSAVSNDLPSSHFIDGSPSLALSLCEGPADATNTLCLFLHGIGGNRSNWNGQLDAVSRHCNAAALDLRGYGDSALGEKQSSVDDYCTDILRAARFLDAEKLILCGLSYGAWIATSFAMRHPDRLAALVLSGGCTGMSEAEKHERDAFRQSRELPMNNGQTPADFAHNVIEIIAGPMISEDAHNELLASMRAIPSTTYADALRCFTNPTEQFDFTALSMPVLLMTGDSDRLAPPQEINQVATRIFNASPAPDVRYECLKDAGHVCNLEAPDAYNAPLIELIKRVMS